MKFGFIPTEGGRFFQEFLDEVILGEELGFDSVWLEEHHGVVNHYWPSPLVVLAGVAPRTERILLGTDVVVLPFYHPVRIAEDTAMLQIMSNGRFILGAAIGYKPDEFALYQTPLEMRGARYQEAVQLIRALWTQPEVSFAGEYYQVDGLRIEPRPETPPQLWLGGVGRTISTARRKIRRCLGSGANSQPGKVALSTVSLPRKSEVAWHRPGCDAISAYPRGCYCRNRCARAGNGRKAPTHQLP